MKKYDIYWARVFYEEIPGKYKNRPILILDNDIVLPLSAKITSKPARKVGKDYSLKDWQIEGLKLPSVVRLDHLQKSKPYFYIGHLSDRDQEEIEKMLIK
jgi:hypothetical protein